MLENDIFSESLCEFEKKNADYSTVLLNETLKTYDYQDMMKRTRQEVKYALNATKNLLGSDESKSYTSLKSGIINNVSLPSMIVCHYKIEILNKI